MIFDRIEELCKRNNTTVTALCIEITGSSGNLPTWKKDNIKASSLKAICQKFNISSDYLLGLVSTDYLLLGKEPEQNIIPALSKDDLELLELYHQLSERDQGQCVGFIKGLIKREPVEDTVPKKKVAER